MKVENEHYRSVWVDGSNPEIIKVIDQTKLPHRFEIKELASCDDVIHAIKAMIIRGAPLIGVTAAYGIYLASLEAGRKSGDIEVFDKYISIKAEEIKATRPTAVNLFRAVERMLKELNRAQTVEGKIHFAFIIANSIAEEDVAMCRKIGENGLEIIEKLYANKKGGVLNILTHCNAGWLATTDYGTALAPVYLAKRKGIQLHVWVEETRPRNQGAKLTAWELGQEGIPHTIITDNAGGYVMQKGLVDAVFVGSDRTTATGDVCNKIGTYKTALAAKDNNVPFYAAVPSSSIDKSIKDGLKEIIIEERDADEVRYVEGFAEGKVMRVLIAPESSPVKNYGFDITPARLVTGIVTEKGVFKPGEIASK